MEILSQTTHWEAFIFVSIVAVLGGLLTLCVTIFGFIECAKYRNQSDLIASIVCLVLTALLTAGIIVLFHSGPDVTYKAKITDFNTVYKKGYEIVDHTGKLYEIRKEAK